MNLGQLLGEREVYGLEWKPDGVRSLKPEPAKTGREAVMITFVKDRVVDRSPYSPSAALAIRSGAVHAYGVERSGTEDDEDEADAPKTAPVETAKVHQQIERKPRGITGSGRTTLFSVPAENPYRSMPMKDGVLTLLRKFPGPTLLEIATETGYARNSVTTLLCILKTHKLIEHAGSRGNFRYYLRGQAPR